MDLPVEIDEFIRESIEDSLSLPVSAKNLKLKLLATEDALRRSQDRAFSLQERLKEAESRLEKTKAEAAMNAQGLRRCIGEKEELEVKRVDFEKRCTMLERECCLYDQDMQRLVESCDDLEKENKEWRERMKDPMDVLTLVAEIEKLKKDKENLRINLLRAEEEAKVLSDENNILDEENKWLHGQLKREKGSVSIGKRSASSAKGKRKSHLKSSCPGNTMDLNGVDSPRPPLSPLQANSPDFRPHKK